MKKIIYLVLISLILLFSISGVLASEIDVNKTGEVSGDMLAADSAVENQLGSGNIIYISPDGSGDGLSENNPTKWSDALNKVTSGDTIKFANGTYYDIKDDYVGNIKLVGSGETVIDANGSGGFFSTYGSITLENLSFINAYTGDKQGNPDGPSTGYDGEGAIVNNGQLTVKNCYFASNQGIGTEGGAIHNSGTCYVYDSTFFRNGGKKGGAIYSDKNSYLYVYNSLINKCVSREGSAVHAKEAYVEIHNTSVVNASAKNGLFYVKKSTVKFYDSYFYNSKAVDAAGVINIDKESSVYVDNCIFDQISSTGTKLWFHDEYGSGDGGVIVVEKDVKDVVIKNSVFTNCTAKGYGGVLYIESSAAITIDNCTFKSNNAAYGDNIYSAKYASRLTITNSLFEIKSTITTSDIDYGEAETIKITVDDGTNNILNPSYSVTVNNQTYSIDSGSVSISSLNVGNYTAILTAGDYNSNKYIFTQDSSLFIVGGDDLEVDVSFSFNEDQSLNIKVIDIYNRPVSNKQLAISVDGKNYTAITNSNGIATIVLDLNEGEYNISVNMEGKIISNSSQKTINVTNNTNVPITDEVYVSFSYTADSLINIEVKDKYNRVIVGNEVIITINTITYSSTTDENGIATVNPDKNVAGEYEVKLEIKNKTIVSAPKTVKVMPSSTTSSVISEDMIRAFNSQYDFKARFLDKNSNPLKNKLITFILNGNEYEVVTDEFGYAVFKNSLLPGTYSIISFNPSTNEEKVNNITIVSRIDSNRDVSADYANTFVYSVRVYADNGHTAAAGEKVVFKINGKTVKTVTTNKDGYAVLSIKDTSLVVKTYKLTAEYKGVSVSNNLVVKQILKAKNVKIKLSKKTKTFKAALKTSSGKAIKSKKITFKIKGKTYSSRTDKKGIATVKITQKLKAGKYKITISYLKNTITKTLTVKI